MGTRENRETHPRGQTRRIVSNNTLKCAVGIRVRTWGQCMSGSNGTKWAKEIVAMRREILDAFTALTEYALHARSFSPRLSNDLIGALFYVTPKYFQQSNRTTITQFNRPIDLPFVKLQNEVAHWTNQNIIVRLYSILDEFNVFKYAWTLMEHKVPTSGKGTAIKVPCEDWSPIMLVYALRQRFAHERGRFDCHNEVHRGIQCVIDRIFQIDSQEAGQLQEFALPVDEVIVPLISKCQEFVKKIEANAE